jgi:hypothetical protein
MTTYPRQLTQRFAQTIQDMQARIRKLETRTAGIDSGATLAALPATIDPGYTTGDPMVAINGSATLTGPCNHLASYTPAADDAVLVIPLPVTQSALTAYLILGKIA